MDRETEIRAWHRLQRHRFERGGWIENIAAWARWRDLGIVLDLLTQARSTPPKRPASSDDTIAMPTPATVVKTIDPGDQFAMPPEAEANDLVLGWEACRVAAEARVADAISGVIRRGGTAVDARTQAIAAIRLMRR